MPCMGAVGFSAFLELLMADTKDPPVYICTLSDSDKGEQCRWCGFATGSGHGKTRD